MPRSMLVQRTNRSDAVSSVNFLSSPNERSSPVYTYASAVLKGLSKPPVWPTKINHPRARNIKHQDRASADAPARVCTPWLNRHVN